MQLPPSVWQVETTETSWLANVRKLNAKNCISVAIEVW